MGKYVSMIKVLIIVSAIVPLYQNCGRLKSSGTNGTFGSSEARNSDFDFKVYNTAYDEITDLEPTFNVDTKYNFRINKEKLPEALIFWDLLYLGASCDLKVFEDKETAELTCFSGGNIGVSVTAVYPNGSEKYGEIRGFVFDSGISEPGSNIMPVTVIIETSGNSQDWAIQNTPSGEVNLVSGSGVNRTVIVYKGQPIRIVNNNPASEHKPGGVNAGVPCKSAPFPLKTGQSYDCIPDTALAEFSKYIWDENEPSAGGRFGFKVVDSRQVFTSTNCTSCHGVKGGNSPQDILNKLNTAINDVPGMNMYSSLTNEERRALAFFSYYQPK